MEAPVASVTLPTIEPKRTCARTGRQLNTVRMQSTASALPDKLGHAARGAHAFETHSLIFNSSLPHGSYRKDHSKTLVSARIYPKCSRVKLVISYIWTTNTGQVTCCTTCIPTCTFVSARVVLPVGRHTPRALCAGDLSSCRSNFSWR